jgi:hypothetical protein
MEEAMAATKKVTVSVQPAVRRPTSAERQAAHAEKLANHQAKLKQEAAERRQKRIDDPASAPPSTRSGVKRRPR